MQHYIVYLCSVS